MLGLDPDAAAGQLVNCGIRFSQKHIFPGHDLLETTQLSQIDQSRAGTAAAGGGSQRQDGAIAMKLAYHVNHSWNWGNIESHLPEDAILAPAEFLEFRLRTVSKKMAQDIGAFAPIKNEIEIRVRYVASERLKEQTPRPSMHRMTVHQDAIHVEDDAAQLSRAHEFPPGVAGPASAVRPFPGQVLCAL